MVVETTGTVESGAAELAPAQGRGFARAGAIARAALELALLPLLLVLAWELAGELIGTFWVSKPTLVAGQLVKWTTSGFLFVHLGATVWAILLGTLIGAACGIALGVVLGAMPDVAEVVNPYLLALYSLPKIAIAPLLVLFLGVGMQAQLALVAFAVFFLVFLNTYSGVRDVDRDFVDALQVMGARPLEVIWKVTLPSATRWILTGLRISVRYAFTTAVLGEMIAGNRGIGFVAQRSAATFDSTGVFTAIVVLMVLGLAITLLLTRVEASLLQWKL